MIFPLTLNLRSPPGFAVRSDMRFGRQFMPFEDFESFRLTVKHHEGCTLQLINGGNRHGDSWQTWKRKRRLGRGAFSDVWQEASEDEYGDIHYRAVKIRIDYQRELSAPAAFS